MTQPGYVTVEGLTSTLTAALKNRFELTVADLGRTTTTATVVAADGFLWQWQQTGTVDGTTVVAGSAAKGGFWHKRIPVGGGGGTANEERLTAIEAVRPVYNIEAFGTAQKAIDATPLGRTTDLSKGETVTAGLVATGDRNLKGSGIYAGLIAGAALPITVDLLTVRPTADNSTQELFTIQNLFVRALAGGRNAVTFDLRPGADGRKRRMARVRLENCYFHSARRYALEVLNPDMHADVFFASEIQGGVFDGGVNIQGGGDSLIFRGGTFTGPNESIRIRLITEPQTPGETGDSSQFVLDGANCTGDRGIYYERGPRPRIMNGNFECGAGPGTAESLFYFEGAADDYIKDGSLTGSYVAASPHAKFGITLNYTNFFYIGNNTIAAPGGTAGSAGVRILGNAKNTIIGPNTWEAVTNVIDDGIGTMGIVKTLALGAGVTVNSGSAAPAFIKEALADAGEVRLSGSATVANTADAIIGTLPVGFRPTQTVFATAYTRDTDYKSGLAFLYVGGDGTVRLLAAVEGLAASLRDVDLGNIRFRSPFVP